MKKSYYHVFANGGESNGFIISDDDFYAAFNRVGVCAYQSEASVLAFSIEETHPHFLLYGTEEACSDFMKTYERSTLQYIVATRGSGDNVYFRMSMYEVDSEDYLMNVASYVIVQPTKDGKKVMPYDYKWGTASLYFRSEDTILPWYIRDKNFVEEKSLSELTLAEKRSLLHSRKEVPSKWKVCNGFLLPTNYVDVSKYEAIYKTHNCFRTFMNSGKKHDDSIVSQMAKIQTPMLEDLEAKRICAETSLRLFGHTSLSQLSVPERISLAQVLRNDHGASVRQIASLLRIKLSELRKFVR